MTEDYSVPGGFVSFFPLFFAYLMNKPYCLIGASIGPFNNRYLRSFAKFILKNAKLITSRERITQRYLVTELNINKKKVIPVADLAFLLEATDGNRLNDILDEIGIENVTKPIVGISISYIIYKWGFSSLSLSEKRGAYIDVFSHFLDEIIRKYNIHLLFVPHVMMPLCDDRIISREIIDKMIQKEDITITEREYLPGELKGIIKQCNIFIASRMHAAIAALSQCIPTLTLAYSHKTIGIVGEMLKMNDCLIDVRRLSKEKFEEDLRDKFAYVYDKVEIINKSLVKTLDSVRSDSEKNVNVVLNELTRIIREI